MIQPVGTIMQIAYVVDDLEAAVRRFAKSLNAGPFFLLEHLQLVDPHYRGKPADTDCSIALGYSGSLCVELIQQHDDSPSVFRECLERQGGGFHHWAVMTESFDSDLEHWKEQGVACAFDGAVAIGGRFAYVDTVDQLGGMIELIELTPPVRSLFEGFAQAARDWDGAEPVRRP